MRFPNEALPGLLQGPGLSRSTNHSASVADFCAAPLAGICAAIDTSIFVTICCGYLGNAGLNVRRPSPRPCIAAHTVAIAPSVEPTATHGLPAERAHDARKAMHTTCPALDGHFQMIEDLMCGNPLDAVMSDLPLHVLEFREPGVIAARSASGECM
jgi:hypothetical protein